VFLGVSALNELLKENLMVPFEHFSHKIVYGGPTFKVVLPSMLLNELIKQLLLHYLYLSVDHLLLIDPIFLLSPTSFQGGLMLVSLLLHGIATNIMLD
jgi:hypothetical protein